MEEERSTSRILHDEEGGSQEERRRIEMESEDREKRISELELETSRSGKRKDNKQYSLYLAWKRR